MINSDEVKRRIDIIDATILELQGAIDELKQEKIMLLQLFKLETVNSKGKTIANEMNRTVFKQTVREITVTTSRGVLTNIMIDLPQPKTDSKQLLEHIRDWAIFYGVYEVWQFTVELLKNLHHLDQYQEFEQLCLEYRYNYWDYHTSEDDVGGIEWFLSRMSEISEELLAVMPKEYQNAL